MIYTRNVTLFKVSMTHESLYHGSCTEAMKILVFFIVLYEIKVEYSYSPKSDYLSQSNFHNLQKIQLDKNQIGDEGIKYLCKAKFPFLEILFLSKNKITIEGFKYFYIDNFLNLKRAFLHQNDISRENQKIFLEILKEKFPQLEINI